MGAAEMGRAGSTQEEALAERVRRGERRAIAQAISRVENAAPNAAGLGAELAPHLGRAHVVGITGTPGAGKSTLVNALLGVLLARGGKVAVLAVDPSSPVTGGAVLGDRVRMGQHGAHPDVFIRSVASRGALGGLSRSTRQIIDVFDAAGFDTVIVETVGAGQSEVAITALADTRVVVCPPGLGDDVQAIKAGILEIADVLVVNKADLPTADATLRDLRDMLRLRANRGEGVAVLPTVATRGDGLEEFADALAAHRDARGVGQRLRGGVGPAADDDATGDRRPAYAHGARVAVTADDTGRPLATINTAPASLRGSAAQPTAAGDAILVGRSTDADADADAAARVMALAARPDFARALGVRCVEGGAGRAVVQVTIGDAHLNFNGACHGGMLFTLADTAFGLASNAAGILAVGIDTHMTFHVGARKGDILTATATEVSRSRRIAVYRVDVKRADGALLGTFTGTVYITSLPNPAGSSEPAPPSQPARA
ncbi:MAG: methylmalonyl Co-A mutase-associated GTPase MeaB [Casimicrobiaceae bacterium]